jgi:hypothetical protein
MTTIAKEITLQDAKAALWDSGIMQRSDWAYFVNTADYGRSIGIRVSEKKAYWLIKHYRDEDEYYGCISCSVEQMNEAIAEMKAYAATVKEI